MRIELGGPHVIDLDRGGCVWEATGGPCALCRRERELYRLLGSPDALCRDCFVMWFD